MADVQEAADILAKARLRLDTSDSKLTAEVFLAEGIVYSVMGIVGQLHYTIVSFPSPFTYHSMPFQPRIL